MMNERDQATLDAVRRMYSQPPYRISATALVRHDPLTGEAYVDMPVELEIGLAKNGHDPDVFIRNYEDSLRRSGLWPADIEIPQRRRVRRWSRRGWRVVIGGVAVRRPR